MKIKVSDKVIDKLLKKHRVSLSEVEQCINNREGRTLLDDRAEHQSEPPTRWFIAETNCGRVLKIVYILHPVTDGKGLIELRSAYPPDQTEIEIYERHGK